MKKHEQVTLTASEQQGVRGPVFIPQGASQDSYFIKYDIHDTGEGFPANKSLEDCLAFRATTKKLGTGFGLYFATLASKYLQAPIGITSEPGNTHVTLYHPVNLGQ